VRLRPLKHLDKEVVKGIDNKFIIFDWFNNLAERDLKFKPGCWESGFTNFM
jgi:hypothetical protein